MRTIQCGNCLRYRGDLQCDAFPRDIPEDILTGAFDHTQEYAGDNGIRFSPAPEFQKSLDEREGLALVQHVNDVVEREDQAYRRVKEVLQRRGYMPGDFEVGGVLHGWSVNQLLELIRGEPKGDEE